MKLRISAGGYRVSVRVSALVFGCLAWTTSAWPAGPAADPPSAAQLKLALQHVKSADAAATAAKNTADQEQGEVGKLAAAHPSLARAVTSAKTALAGHTRAALAAYCTPKPSAKPAPKAELPKVSALKAAQSEYSAVLTSLAALSRARADLSANEAQLAARADAAALAATKAKAAVAEGESAVKLLKSAERGTAPSAEKEKAESAAAQLANARAAASSAAAAAQKARSAPGVASPGARVAAQAAATREDEQLEQQRASANATLKEVGERLRLQNPPVPGCDLHKVPWRDMTYPWLPWGTQHRPLTLKNGTWVCDEPNADNCNNTPSVGEVTGSDDALVLGDLDGDGKPEAALHVLEFCCDVATIEVLVFKQDSECHLDYVGSIGLTNVSGQIAGGAFVVDQPFARKGENLGLGAVSGLEHQEWRIVAGKLRQTKSVKSVVPLQ